MHRDIKPANIRIGRHGTVKLLDFGIARTDVLTREAKTATDTIVGSLPYMAPERFWQAGDPHPASDVFALGCVLYEGIARRRLFHRFDMARMVGLAHSNERFNAYVEREVARLPGDLLSELRQLLQASLAYDPEARRPTALPTPLAQGGLGSSAWWAPSNPAASAMPRPQRRARRSSIRRRMNSASVAASAPALRSGVPRTASWAARACSSSSNAVIGAQASSHA